MGEIQKFDPFKEPVEIEFVESHKNKKKLEKRQSSAQVLTEQ